MVKIYQSVVLSYGCIAYNHLGLNIHLGQILVRDSLTVCLQKLQFSLNTLFSSTTSELTTWIDVKNIEKIFLSPSFPQF